MIPREEGCAVHAGEVEGPDSFEDMVNGEAMRAAGERSPDLTVHLFRSSDFSCSLPGVGAWGRARLGLSHAFHAPAHDTGRGLHAISYQPEDSEVHTVEAGPAELVYLSARRG